MAAVNNMGSASPQQGGLEPCRIHPPEVVLRAVDECHGHLVGVAPLQFGIAVDINDRVALAGLGTNGCHLRDRLVAQVAALSREYDDPLRPLGELDHITIFHDAGDVTSEGRRRRAARLLASGSGTAKGCPAADSLSPMLFTAATLRGLLEGRVTCTYRRWDAYGQVGSRFTTAAGVVEVTSITPAQVEQLTEQDAADAGFDSVAALVKWTSAKGGGDVYRIGIALAGPDPRVALRGSDQLDVAEVSALNAKLERMDRAAEQPWTRSTLRQIQRVPGVVSTELAAEAGQQRHTYKPECAGSRRWASPNRWSAATGSRHAARPTSRHLTHRAESECPDGALHTFLEYYTRATRGS